VQIAEGQSRMAHVGIGKDDDVEKVLSQEEKEKGLQVNTTAPTNRDGREMGKKLHRCPDINGDAQLRFCSPNDGVGPWYRSFNFSVDADLQAVTARLESLLLLIFVQKRDLTPSQVAICRCSDAIVIDCTEKSSLLKKYVGNRTSWTQLRLQN